MLSKRIGFLAVWLALAQAASGQDSTLSDPIAPSLESLSRLKEQLNIRSQLTPSSPTSPAQIDVRARSASDTNIIDPASISAASTSSGSVSGARAGTRSAAGGVPTHPLQLELNGEALTIDLLQQTEDFSLGVRHVSGVIRGANPGLVRFSVVGNTGDLTATFSTRSGTYRLLQVAGQSFVVERIDSRRGRAGFTRVDQRLRQRVNDLERAHVRMEALASMQPWRALTPKHGSPYLIVQGGDLGAIEAKNAQSVRQWLGHFSEFIDDRETLDIRIVRSRQTSSRAIRDSLQFVQYVNDVLVEARNEITLGSGGRVEKVTIALLDPRTLSMPTVSIEQARTIADGQLRVNGFGGLDRTKPMIESLSFRPFPGQQGWLPVYRFIIETETANVIQVLINGMTGEAVAAPTLREMLTDICTGGKVGGAVGVWAKDCSEPGAYRIHTETSPGVSACVDTSLPVPARKCNKIEYTKPRDILQSIENELGTATAGNPAVCCGGLADLDVLIDSEAFSNSGYDYFKRSIHVRGTHSGWSTSFDFVAHEFGHHYIASYNPVLVQDGSAIGRAMQEGLADTIAATLAERIGSSYSAGSAWTIGDGQPALSVTRVHSSPALSWSHLNNAVGEHEKGRAFGNFFYRLRNMGVFSNDRFAEYVLDVTRGIVDLHGDGFDLADFQSSLLGALAPGETSLLNAVNSVFSAMNDLTSGPGGSGDVPTPPGSPSPPGAPTAPSSLSIISSVGCVYWSPPNAWLSTWNIGWSASAGATRYDIYSRDPQGLFYDYLHSVTGTAASAGTNYSTVFRVRACNASGCSALSTSNLPLNNAFCQ